MRATGGGDVALLESRAALEGEASAAADTGWGAEVAAFIERDTRQAHRRDDTGEVVLNRPGMRWFVRQGAVAVVSRGVELDTADAVISADAGDLWGVAFLLEGVEAGEQASQLGAPLAVDAVDNLVLVDHGSGVEQIHENLPEGIEQRFIVNAGAPGEVRLLGRFTGFRVQARLDEAGGVVFSKAGVDVVQVSRPRAFTPQGEELACEFVLGLHTLDIVIHGVGEYPVLVDPVWTSLGEDQSTCKFGFSVAGAGDINGDGYADVLVGAPEYDTTASNAGRAYLFNGQPGGLASTPAWSGTALAQSGAQFGFSVSAAGDTDDDGNPEIMVGSPYENTLVTDIGRVRVYEASSGVLPAATAATWTLTGPSQASAYFGTSIALIGDHNNDGKSDIVVGAPGYNNGSKTDTGRVEGFNGSLSSVSWYSHGPDQANAKFGTSVAGVGDIQNASPAYEDVAAGAPYFDNGIMSDVGQVSAFYGPLPSNGSAVTPGKTKTGVVASEKLGMSVAGAGDMDGDGHREVAAGAPGRSSSAGRIGVFQGTGSGLEGTNWYLGGESQAGAEFGAAVAGAGDVNGDGKDELVVGAPKWDEGGSADMGKVYLVKCSGGSLSMLPSPLLGEVAYAKFGASVAGVGDVNGEQGGGSYADIVVGSPEYTHGDPIQIMSGKAYLYLGGNTESGLCEDGQGCDDFDACTAPDTCSVGVCGGPAVDCDDHDACTSDSCNPAMGCVNTQVDPAVYCNDSNPCTADLCDAGIGCYHPNYNGASCDDGDACTLDDHCAGGACTGTVDCDDDNDCTSDTCQESPRQCVHANHADLTPCDDDDACTAPDVCQGGACQAGAPVGCDDSKPNTVDACDPAFGCIHTDVSAPAGALESFSFLFEGEDAIQQGVAEGTILEARAAVVRGRVFWEDALRQLHPLEGVKAEVLGHPEFGHTSSRSDGWYDLAVNGGGALTVKLSKDGLLPAQRAVPTRWQDFALVPDVVMLPLDDTVSPIDLGSGVTSVQAARGSLESDDDGVRKGTLLFMPGTTASMTVGGVPEPLTDLNVRITEYTVGPNGPARMPAELPPTSGYTYAAELSVDEALAAGATRVDFSAAVVFYLENFVDIAVGVQVPVGIYDHTQGRWVPEHDGRVVKIVSETEGMADLDTDGDGLADSGLPGVTDDERTKLAELYEPGAELWRVALTHFTTIDCNMGPGCPVDEVTGASTCESPDSDGPEDEDPFEEPRCEDGSVIECENGIVGEGIPIVGTPYSLVHWSDRQRGWKPQRKIRIQVTDDDPPDAMMGGYVIVHVAGKGYLEPFGNNTANLVKEIEWDGLDAYGRPVLGSQRAYVDLVYAYPGEWNAPQPGTDYTFAVPGAGADMGAGRVIIYMHQYFQATLTSWDESARGLGGWTIDVNHVLDRSTQIVRLGNGGRKSAGLLSPIVTAFAGNGSNESSTPDQPAISVGLFDPFDVSSGPAGDLFISESGYGGASSNVVRRVDTDGYLRAFAGGGAIDCEDPDNDGDASLAGISKPYGLDSGPNGEVFIAEFGCARIRKVTGDGKIYTVAGTGLEGSDPGEGELATIVKIGQPTDVAVAPDGSFYFVESSAGRVRRVGTDGRVWTVAGCRTGDTECQGGRDPLFDQPATYGSFDGLKWIALGTDGSIYLNHTIGSVYYISRVGTDGILYRFAGGGDLTGYAADGHPAIEASLGVRSSGHPMTVAADGAVYFGDLHALRFVDVHGRLGTLSMQCGLPGYPDCTYQYPQNDGAPVSQASILGALGMDVGPDGKLYVVDSLSGVGRVRAIHTSSPSGFATGEVAVPSRDGRELWVFDSRNLHVRTEDAVTGQHLLEFDYHPDNNRLVGIRDVQAGEILYPFRGTAIEYPNENLIKIIAPDGQTTLLTVSDGYLTAVTSPKDDEVYHVTYKAGPTGLIETFTNPRGLTAYLTYALDGSGRLAKDEDPGDGSWTVTREPIYLLPGGLGRRLGQEVVMKTALLQEKKFRTEETGWKTITRTTTLPDGTEITAVESPGGLEVTTYPDGTVVTVREGAEQLTDLDGLPLGVGRFGMGAPIQASTKVEVPDVPTFEQTVERIIKVVDPVDPFTVTSEEIRVLRNGVDDASATLAFDDVLDVWVWTYETFADRDGSTRLDSSGRVSREEFGGLAPTSYSYDAQGRISTVTLGEGTEARTYTFQYWNDANHLPWQGFPLSVTDPEDRTTTFASYDNAGRVLSAVLPGSRTVGFGFDKNGNVTSITPPGRPAHGHTYSNVDIMTGYDAPDLATPPPSWDTSYAHDADRRATTITRPFFGVITFGYDPVKHRLSGISTTNPDLTDNLGFGYNDTTGQLTSITSSGGVSLAMGYLGFWQASEVWAGEVSGQVTWVPDNNLRLQSETVYGTDPIPFGYDADGLLTAAGDLSLTRDPYHGLVTETDLGLVETLQSHNSFGELASFSATYDQQTPELYSVTYDEAGAYRDALGRVTQKTEFLNSATTVTQYFYDTAGRLEDVCEGGSWLRHYAYDSNSNRTLVRSCSFLADSCRTTCSNPVDLAATYDAQDRILTHGAAAYEQNLNGDLTTRTVGSVITSYTYDAYGNLKQVEVPGDWKIEYVVDGRNRRVARREYEWDGQGQAYVLTDERRWLWQGQLRIVAEIDDTGAITKRFVYGAKVNVPEYMVTYDPVSHLETGTYRILTDQLGSLRLVVDVSAGTVVQRMRHDEWGNVLEDTNPGLVPFGFAGGLYDPDTGLVRFGTRDYDPETGRWTGKDPILFGGGDLGLYTYCGADPVNFVDFLGHGRQEQVGKVVDWLRRHGGGMRSKHNKDETVGDLLDSHNSPRYDPDEDGEEPDRWGSHCGKDIGINPPNWSGGRPPGSNPMGDLPGLDHAEENILWTLLHEMMHKYAGEEALPNDFANDIYHQLERQSRRQGR